MSAGVSTEVRAETASDAKQAAGLRFAGYAALFDTRDAGRDTIRPGAFARSLRERQAGNVGPLPLYWQHRPDIRIGWIEAAREEGDLKENGGYHAAKEEQGKNEARIRQLRQLLENASVGAAPESESRHKPRHALAWPPAVSSGLYSFSSPYLFITGLRPRFPGREAPVRRPLVF